MKVALTKSGGGVALEIGLEMTYVLRSWLKLKRVLAKKYRIEAKTH